MADLNTNGVELKETVVNINRVAKVEKVVEPLDLVLW